MRLSDIREFPNSYFSTLVDEETLTNSAKPIIIDRDGELFRYIVEYHFYGVFPVVKSRLPLCLVIAVQNEAVFYGLSKLAMECETAAIKQIRQAPRYKGKVDCEFYSESKDALVNVISAVWAPFCVTGEEPLDGRKLFKSSTFKEINVEELLAEAAQSSFGRGQEFANPSKFPQTNSTLERWKTLPKVCIAASSNCLISHRA